MYLQIFPLDESLVSLLLALALSILVIGGYIRWMLKRRSQLTDEIDNLMFVKSSVSLTELIEYTDANWIDTKSLMGLINRCKNALLSFSRTSVVSIPLLGSKLKDTIVNNSILHTDKEAIRWDLAPSDVSQLLEDICAREGLDILLTTNGDYLLVPDLKSRIRDSLDLQGRVDVVAEAQRLQVNIDELVSLVKSWGWYTWQSSSKMMYSVRWLLSTLERSVSRKGYLDLDSESERLDLPADDILAVVRLYKWDFVKSGDGMLFPTHTLQDNLLSQLEQLGSIDLNEESARFKIPSEKLAQILKQSGLTLISTDDGSLMTLEQLRSRLVDDVDLEGIVESSVVAKRIGIDAGLADRVLKNHEGIRKSKDGHFISYRSMRSWILDEVQKSGIVNTDKFQEKWTISRVELAAILRRFGLRVVLTKGGNYLSVSWLRRMVKQTLDDGGLVIPDQLASTYDSDIGTVEAIIAGIETDTVLDKDAKMVSKSALFKELEKSLHQGGQLDPEGMATELGFDIADIEG
ncbi:MAG: hypothetical protein P1Q69_15325, partial [Candidatus Thorarchaeota archaeon]|nr:hypothetical protein [Candidatus Thorarchaeota archaeon]